MMNRRHSFQAMGTRQIVDIRGTRFLPLVRPFRVVSLVPSWTETLFHLGLTQREVVGRTDYCIHPKDGVAKVETLGGPKNPNLGRIFKLDPDLIIADREENRIEDVERIDRHWGVSRVMVTWPRTVNHALEDVENLGVLVGAEDEARLLVDRVRSLRASLVREDRGTVAFVIWQDPLMVATRETYIGDLLETLGYRNVFDRSTTVDLGGAGSPSYPVVSLESLIRRRPDAIFLSTEPFPFRRKHAAQIRADLGGLDSDYARRLDVRIVNGEYFSWYGSRMVAAFRYFARKRS